MVLFHQRPSSVHHVPLALVHVHDFAADEGFVSFQRAPRPTTELATSVTALFHRFAEPLKHKPCRLLGDAKRPRQFVRTDAVLAVRQHPHRNQPLVQAKSRILKDRLDLDRELLVAAVAKPDAPRLDERVLFGAAARTDDLATGPAEPHGILKGLLRVGEVRNRLLQRFRFVCHDLIVH